MAPNQPNKKPNNSKKVVKPVKNEKPKLPPVPPRNEIPMYDPQTGEPNPHYEELTGKPNPLIQIRKTTTDSHLILPNHEPKRKNRWLVHFPAHFKIEPWCVSKTQRPSVKIVEKRFLGIRMGTTLDWGKIEFEFIDPISPSISESLHALMEDELTEVFDYKLEMLDPTGKVVETWEIKDCEIISIDLGTLFYGSNDIAKCFMTVKPGNVKLKK
jgi:hypothetical protein